ncbi:dynein axonemal heavy chain 6-like [Palaemon carinicauda]|uniref:dynein axonemal heavy chain 6-like n=1 Tax=Palaemon carinicauda TaxID=392227 RepID=UPI0035B69425
MMKRRLDTGRQQMFALKDENGNIKKKDGVIKIAEDFYTMLHNSDIRNNFAKRKYETPKPVPKVTVEDGAKEEAQTMFLVVIGVENDTIACTPTQEGLVSGLRTILRTCEITIMCVLPLLPYFTPHDRLSAGPPDENVALRIMLEDDAQLRDTTNQIISLVEDYWKKIEDTKQPLELLLKEAQMKTQQESTGESEQRELGTLGTWLARIEGLVTSVGEVNEVVSLGLLKVDQTAAKKVVVTSLRQQQQRMHQEVSQGFDQRVKALQADATDKWLGLEQAPVTAEQVVNLLNYVLEVRGQMDSVGEEEKIIQEAYEMIQGYHITLHPEVHNKYEVLQKEVKRLRRTVRRSMMERPTLIKKLEQLLEKEIEELDGETGKLAEQVQALRFLRVTSDREEAMKMLEAADSRACTIRAQATTIIQYQENFQMTVCAFKELAEVEEEITLKMLLWKSLSEWEALTEDWYQKEVKNLDVVEVRKITFEYRGKVDYLLKTTQHSDVLLHLKSLVNSLEEKLPVLEALTDTALRPRHWQEIDMDLGQPLPSPLTLAQVDAMNLHTHAHTLQQVAHTAQLQREMENRLKQVIQDWEASTIPVSDYVRKDTYQLGNLEPLESLLLSTDITLHLLLHSQHALHIKQETVKWKNIHTIIKGTLTAMKEFEEEWMALDPVLSTVTAHEVFPLQATTFAASTAFWTKVMTRVTEDSLVLSQLRNGMLLEEIIQEKTHLNGLRVCLAPLLAMRRQTCPRLFLLPDIDLLELLTKGQEADICNKYLSRIFTGIGRLIRGEDGQIVALVSPQQEKLRLAKSVVAHHGVEDWIGRVESGMRATLKRLIIKHAKEHLPMDNLHIPLQVLDICRRIQWSTQIIDILDNAYETKVKPNLQSVLTKIEDDLITLQGITNLHVSAQHESRLTYSIITLLSLREATKMLIADKPDNRWSYAWLQHLSHLINGEGRRAKVQVSISVENLDYCYEYMGVSGASIQTPSTMRAHHALITAALNHKIGAVVGGVGTGKTETLKCVARLVGQYLASFNCSIYTPVQSISNMMSGGVQGGFWLLFEEANNLTRPLLARLAHSVHNIYQSKMTALKRCVINGKEMKLVDTFCLFLSVTSEERKGESKNDKSCSLLNHVITPHITSVSICSPSLGTLIEAVLMGHGFTFTYEYKLMVFQCFAQFVEFLPTGTLPPALPRLVQATARVADEIRQTVGLNDNANVKSQENCYQSSSNATPLWMRHPILSPLLTDEEILTQALYAVLTPLLSEREKEWRQIFRKNFNLLEEEQSENTFGTTDIEKTIKRVLLEWGFSKEIINFIGNRENVLERQDSCPSDIALIPQEDNDDDAPCITEEGMLGIQDSLKEMSQESDEEEQAQELSDYGESILRAALHMYSLLNIHHSCCIMAPSGVGKSTVWKVLSESLNRLWSQEVSSTDTTEPRRVSWRVLHCGSFTPLNFLGSWDHNGTKWRKGVFFQALTEAENMKGERWLILVGPFPPSFFSALNYICQPKPTFKDEALHQVTLGHHVRIILELEDGSQMTDHIRVRCPVLRLKFEEEDMTRMITTSLHHLLGDLQQMTQETVNELTSVLTQGLESLTLPHTSQKNTAECICKLTRIRVTPTTSPAEVLEAIQQVIDLFHTARHPHLHKEVREGTYTPARLDSRSPAPSDAFLDYSARVVATSELRAGLDLLPQLLDTSNPLILYSKPGQGLSTFLDMFEKNQAPATRVIRFKCTPLSTAEDLFACMTEVLLPSPLPEQKKSTVIEHGKGSSINWNGKKHWKETPQDPIPVLAPGEGGFSLLILEDVHLQLDTEGVSGTIWEAFRLMVECNEIVCPLSGTRYHLQRVVPLLAMTCTTTPEVIVPTRILRHCIIMALPHNSSATCEHLIKVI